MNRDDIIRMAREAKAKPGVENEADMTFLECFAALVAAAERDRLKWDGLHSCHSECDRPACVHTRKAVEAEREACARVCDKFPGVIGAEDIQEAIRARGQDV